MNKQLDFEPIELNELEGVLGGGAAFEIKGCTITNGKCAQGGCGLCNGNCGFTKPDPDAPTVDPDLEV